MLITLAGFLALALRLLMGAGTTLELAPIGPSIEVTAYDELSDAIDTE